MGFSIKLQTSNQQLAYRDQWASAAKLEIISLRVISKRRHRFEALSNATL